MSYDTARPHTASYVLVHKDAKVAMLLRQNTSWMNGMWGLPAGKIEKGESAQAAAIRVAKEEIGITLGDCDFTLIHVTHRLAEPDNHTDSWIDFVFDVTNYKGKIHNAEPQVHAKLDWFDPNNLPENTIPSVRAQLESIARGEHYMEFGWDDQPKVC